MNRKLSLSALGLAAALAGCTTGNTAVPPSQTAVNPIASNVLKFAVGTANIAGTTGLNTVVTWRQPNGLDGTLLNTPTITGPAGFVNTGGAAAGSDNGTNKISGSPQANPLGSATTPSTFGTSGGAFAYGFQPDNSTTSGGANFSRYSLPFFAPATFTAQQYIGGPPAYPQVRNGNYPSGFLGYPLGFTDFNVAPVAGTYTLTLNVPTGFDNNGNPTSGTVTATGSLTSVVPLPTFATPTIAFDGTGGADVTVTVPAGVTEADVIVRDGDGLCYPSSAPAYYTLRTTTPGPQVLHLPNNLGPTQGNTTSTKTICTGDHVRVYAVGFDYGAFAAGPPNSSAQSPTITNAAGQADITQSAPSPTSTAAP